MKSLFDQDTYSEILSRIEALTENAERQWGKMTTGQMLHHCQGPLNILLEKKDYGLKPNWFAQTFFKKAMYSNRYWRKGLPTIKQFKETEERDFKEEKLALKRLLNEFALAREREDWPPHPAFGTFTKEQWGKMQYKHLDHHLRQFAA